MNKTRFANAELVQTWAKQCQSFGQSNNRTLYFYDAELVSYSTTIALHYGDFILKSSNTFSPATSKQMSFVCRTVSVPIISVDLFSFGKRFPGNSSFPSGIAIRTAVLKKCRTISKRYTKRRTDSTRESDLQMLNAEIENLHFICRRFNLAYPADDLIFGFEICKEITMELNEKLTS